MTPDSATKLLGSLNEGALAAFTTKQISNIPTTVFEVMDAGTLDDLLSSLSVDAAVGITSDQLHALAPEVFASLNLAYLEGLTPAQTGRITDAQIAALNPEQLTALGNDYLQVEAGLDEPGSASVSGDLLVSGGAVTVLSPTGAAGVVNVDTGSGQWSFTLDPGLSDRFAAGELETQVFTILAETGGQVSEQKVFVTVTGTNDAPTVGAALAETTFEDAAAFSIDLLADAADVDNGETATLSVQNVTGLVDGITLNGNTVDVNPADAAFQYLGVGDAEVITVSYEVVDAQGATVAQTATITVNGTNDAPTLDIVAPESTVYVSGQHGAWHPIFATAGVWSSPNGAANGIAEEFEFTRTIDIPADGLYTIELSADNYGTAVIGGVTVTSGTYTSVSSGQVTLSAGAHDIDILGGNTGGPNGVAVRILDDQGNVVWTPHDALNITLPILSAVEDGAAVQIELSQFAGDVDSDDDGTTQNYTVSGAPSEGVATISGTTLNFDPANDFQDLADGETRDFTIEVTATDSHGATAIDTVTGTVTGTNDTPVAVGDTGAVSEDGPGIIIDLLGNDTDVDVSDLLSIDSFDFTGTDGTVTDNGDGTVTYDPSGAFEGLNDGDTDIDSFSYTVSDGNGGFSTADVDVTIDGVTDSTAAVRFTANLLAGSYNGGTSQLYIGLVDTDADGTPNTATTTGNLTDPGYSIEGAIAGDIDGDGDADFLFGNGDTTIAINLGDTDNDGVPEYQNITLVTPTITRNHMLADLDNDDDLDIVAHGRGEGYFLNLGDTNNDGMPEFGNYIALPGNGMDSWGGPASGDFDGDSNVDIVVSQWAGDSTQIFYGQGDIDADPELDFTVQTFSNNDPMGVAVADFDGDGDDDFITSSWSSQSTELYTNIGDNDNDGQVEFAVTAIPVTGQNLNIWNQEVADFDGDGDLDFAASFGSGDQLVFYNQGDTNNDGSANFIVDEIPVNLSGSRFGSSSGDYDNDGDVDLVFSGTSDGQVYIAQNLGNIDADPFVEWQIDTLDGALGTRAPIFLTDDDLFGLN
jgi:VCBS repeat-containing protein